MREDEKELVANHLRIRLARELVNECSFYDDLDADRVHLSRSLWKLQEELELRLVRMIGVPRVPREG